MGAEGRECREREEEGGTEHVSDIERVGENSYKPVEKDDGSENQVGEKSCKQPPADQRVVSPSSVDNKLKKQVP